MSSILIAEDEKNIADVVKDILEAEGYDVRVVRNGVAAIAAYHERRPDLLILDVMMPRKGGFEVCAEIREVDELTPILFLTARDADVDTVSTSGPTIISPSRSARRSSWRAWPPFSAAPP